MRPRGACAMRKKIEYMVSFIVFSLLVAPAFSQASLFSSDTISSSGVIQYGNAFVNRGAAASIEVFTPGSTNYRANAWQLLKGAGINTLCVWGGITGDVAHFNINNYPNEWAQNLDNFLTQADAHGIKVYFFHLGYTYGTLFGIISPGDPGSGPLPPTPLSQALVTLDRLAGNNVLNHNFLADPRVIGWRSSNELNLASTTVYFSGADAMTILQWNLAICDYIRSKGGKAWLSAPNWSGNQYFDLTEPHLRGHVDFLEAHPYLNWDFVNTCGMNYASFYNFYKSWITNHLINQRAGFSLNQVIIGEFGIWRGQGSDNGVTANFTDQQRQTYYQAVYDALRDAGVKNTSLWDFFALSGLSNDYGIVDTNGSPYPLVYNVVQTAYT